MVSKLSIKMKSPGGTKMTVFGYARVSTLNQDLESQLQQLNEEGATVIFKEKFTGTTTERPELQKLLFSIQRGDQLIVTKLDRLARNTKEGIEIIEKLLEMGVDVEVLNIGKISDTTIGRFLLQTLLAVAEMERNMIIERTQEGKAIARQREGYREGRKPKFKKAQLDNAMKLKSEGYSFSQVAEISGISIATLKRESSKRKKHSEL